MRSGDAPDPPTASSENVSLCRGSSAMAGPAGAAQVLPTTPLRRVPAYDGAPAGACAGKELPSADCGPSYTLGGVLEGQLVVGRVLPRELQKGQDSALSSCGAYTLLDRDGHCDRILALQRTMADMNGMSVHFYCICLERGR